MGADAALINALTKAEYAKNVPDLSRIFEMSYGGAMAVVAGGESAAKSISAAVMEKNLRETERLEAERKKIEAWKEGILSEFDKRTNEAYQTLSTQAEGGEEGPMNQKFADMAWEENGKIRDKIEKLLDQPKSKERDKSILDLRMKSNKITNGLVGMRGGLLTIAQTAGTSKGESGVNTEASFAKDGGEGMRTLTRVFTNDGYAGITPVVDDNGNLFIDIERAVVMSRDELLDQPKSKERDKSILDLRMKSNKITNGLVGMRGGLLTIAQTAGTSKGESGVNTEASFAKDGGEGMRTLTRVFTNDGYAGITPVVDDNGNLFIDIERAVVMSRDELLEKGFSEEDADRMIKDGSNITMKTTQMTAADLSDLVVWKDEDAQVGIMAEITASAETASSKENKERMKFGQEPKPFNFEGTKDNILKQIRTKSFGNKKENLYDMIYAEFNGQKSSYAEATKNHPVIQAARYAGVTVGDLGPADADSDGDVELTRTADGGFVDESGNPVSNADWTMLQEKLLKPETQEEKDAVAEDIAWYYTRQGEVKFNDDVASYKDMVTAANNKTKPNGGEEEPAADTRVIGDSTYAFRYPASTGDERLQREKIVIPALRGDAMIYYKGRTWEKVEGGYKEVGDFYQDVEGEQVKVEKEVEPISTFINKEGGSQQPTLISGSGLGTGGGDAELEALIFKTKWEELSEEELNALILEGDKEAIAEMELRLR